MCARSCCFLQKVFIPIFSRPIIFKESGLQIDASSKYVFAFFLFSNYARMVARMIWKSWCYDEVLDFFGYPWYKMLCNYFRPVRQPLALVCSNSHFMNGSTHNQLLDKSLPFRNRTMMDLLNQSISKFSLRHNLQNQLLTPSPQFTQAAHEWFITFSHAKTLWTSDSRIHYQANAVPDFRQSSRH